jgi:hypothetical protein
VRKDTLLANWLTLAPARRLMVSCATLLFSNPSTTQTKTKFWSRGDLRRLLASKEPHARLREVSKLGKFGGEIGAGAGQPLWSFPFIACIAITSMRTTPPNLKIGTSPTTAPTRPRP